MQVLRKARRYLSIASTWEKYEVSLHCECLGKVGGISPLQELEPKLSQKSAIVYVCCNLHLKGICMLVSQICKGQASTQLKAWRTAQ